MADRRAFAKAIAQYGFTGTLALLTAFLAVPSGSMLIIILLMTVSAYTTYKIREKYGTHLHHEKSTAALGTWLNIAMVIFGVVLYLVETFKFKLS